jgi:tape measure domain-containing protein
MANKGDVDLVIRAKNEAGKSLDAISKALDDLDKKQNAVGGSADKAGNLLDQFAKTAGLVASAYQRLKSDADRAAEAFSRQEATLAENKAAYAALVGQLEAAERVQKRMASFVGPMPKGSEKQAQLVAKAYTDLNNQAQKLAATIDRQEADLKQSFYAFQEVSGGADQAAAALERVRAAHQRAADAAAADAAAQQRAAAMQDRIAQSNRNFEETLKARRAAEAASAAESARLIQERNAATAARRPALEVRRDLTNALGTAVGGQAAAQAQIKALADQQAAGQALSSEQVAQMARSTAYAGAYKQAVNELRIAIELYNRVLRDSGATQAQITAAQQRAQATLAGVTNLMRQTTASVRETGAAQREKVSVTQEEEQANKKLDNALQSLFSNSRRSLSLYQRWRGEVLSLISGYVGLMAAIQGVNQVLQASMQMQGAQSRLNVVTGGDASKTAAEMAWVVKEADRLGIALDVLSGEWSKFAVAATASNFTIVEARKIFMSVAEAGRVLKLDSTSMSQAFLALTQMMSKGTIQMEELRQQLGEHIPGAFAMMAKAVGVSGAELTKMMEKGQLSSDYLLKFADTLDERYGKQLPNSLRSTQAEIGRFQANLTVALNAIAEAGVLDAFTEALRKLTDMLRGDEAKVWFQRIGAAVGGVIKILMSIVDNIDLIIAGFTALAGAKGVGYVVSLTQAIISMVAAMRGAATAGAALSLGLAGLGGPIGLAIGVLAGAFAYLTLRVSESEKAMESAKRVSDEIVNSYRMGAKTTQDYAEALKGMSNLQIERSLDALKKKLADATNDLGSGLQQTFVDDFGRVIELPIDAKTKQFKDLVDGVKSGQIPLSEFKKRLDEIAKNNPDMKELALRLQDQAEEAIKTDTALRRFEASLRLTRGTATDADKALLGVAKAVGDTGDSLETAAAKAERFRTAMDNLGKNIPEIKRKLDLDASLKAVDLDLAAALQNAGNDESLQKAARDRAEQAKAALRKAYDESLISEFGKNDAMLQSVNLLKQFEGFKSQAYWDVNAYRVGYGSSTTTASDGTVRRVTQDTTTTEVDALRDLVRRIGEFQDVIKTQIGSERFGAFTAPQQAALTSLAYNYGSLPKDIVQAIKTGNNEAIAAAIRNRASDNGGVNAGRRNREADILALPSPEVDALLGKQAQARQDRVTKVIEDLAISLKEAKLGERDKFIEEALKKAQPTDVNAPRLTPEQEASVREQAGQTFDAKQALVVQQKIVDLERQLAESKAGTNRQEFIEVEARKQKIDLLTQEGQKWAALQGQVWDRANAEKSVNDLMAVRKQLQDQLLFEQNQGNTGAAQATQEALNGINDQLRVAIGNAIKFWESMSPDTNPQAKNAILNLQNMKATIDLGAKRTLDAKQINESFTSGAVQGFDSIAEAMAGWLDGTKSGKEALMGIRNAFLKFAADFLKQIANMILQQIIFNAVSGAASGGSGAGGIGGAIAGALSSAAVMHSGGTVGSAGRSRTVSTAMFAGAVRYHTGGFAGLQPGEVPAVLQRGEEVLARNDPRNMLNGGGSSQSPVTPRIVNVLDPSLVQDHLESSAGEQVLVNVIRRNGASIKQILSEA